VRSKVLSEQYWEEQPFKWLIFLNYNRGCNNSGFKRHGNLDVLVGDLLKFRGSPGVKKNRNAIKITEVIRREDE